MIPLISSHAAQPVLFKTHLQNLERQAGESASLCCETTKPGASLVWRHGDKVLSSSSKYRLRRDGRAVALVICKLQRADAGVYSCDTGSQRTTAVLTVQGRSDNSLESESSQYLSTTCISAFRDFHFIHCIWIFFLSHVSLFHISDLFPEYLMSNPGFPSFQKH